MNQPKSLPSAAAFRFVLIIGIANLFADMTYEGARSVTGAFLASLGASAAVVGFTAGFGELVGYALRSVTGYLSTLPRNKGSMKTGPGFFETLFNAVMYLATRPANTGW